MKKYLFLFIPLVVAACVKDEFEGPDLNDLYGELEILSDLAVVGDGADFSANETIHFTAEFSKQVDWTLTIVGLNSGSTKVITGKSNYIDSTNSIWDGSSTTLPFFVAEDCSVDLTFEMEADNEQAQSVGLTIAGAKVYNDASTRLITDFENGFNPNFTGYFQAGTTDALTTGGAGQGTKYLSQFGTVNWDWLIGYKDYWSAYWFDQEPLVNDPSQVYFNIMIKGDSTLSDATGLPNSLFKLEFWEDDNQDGFYSEGAEDKYSYEFDVDWTGWKMISVAYNDEDKLVLEGAGGDVVRSPQKISNVRTLLLANPESGYAHADVDFLIWSIGAPILN